VKLSKGILRNNLIALAIHAAVSAAAFFCIYIVLALVSAVIYELISPNFSEIFLIIAGASVVALSFAAYVFAGYRFLRPLSRWNLLSIVFPGLFFALVTAVGLVSTTFWHNEAVSYIAAIITGLFNFPAFVTLSFSSSLFGGGGLDFGSSAEGATAFIMFMPSTMLPSILVYVGLRLKIGKNNRAAKNLDNGEESSDGCTPSDR